MPQHYPALSTPLFKNSPACPIWMQMASRMATESHKGFDRVEKPTVRWGTPQTQIAWTNGEKQRRCWKIFAIGYRVCLVEDTPAIHCWLGIHSRFVTFLASESRVNLHLFRFEILMLCLLWYVETAQNHVAPKSGLYLHSSPCLHARMSVFKLHIDHMIFINDAASISSLLTHHSQFRVPPWRIIPWIIIPIGLASK
jgi:hypothetical protein